MSVEAFTWALNAPLGGTQKILLLGLANHAHPDGTEAYPAVETLAIYAHCDTRTVQRNLRKMVADGVVIEDGKGPRGQNKYRLPMGGWQSAGGGIPVPEGVASVPPEPSREPSISMWEARVRDGVAPHPVKFKGKPVPAAVADAAARALRYWHDTTGDRVLAYTATGEATESLRRVVGAMLSYPRVVEEWQRLIDATLAAPWWEGPPSVGVVFGPKVVERNLARMDSPVPLGRRAAGVAVDQAFLGSLDRMLAAST